jgi:hypothetical protein
MIGAPDHQNKQRLPINPAEAAEIARGAPGRQKFQAMYVIFMRG